MKRVFSADAYTVGVVAVIVAAAVWQLERGQYRGAIFFMLIAVGLGASMIVDRMLRPEVSLRHQSRQVATFLLVPAIFFISAGISFAIGLVGDSVSTGIMLLGVGVGGLLVTLWVVRDLGGP